jgi:integrase
LALGASWVQIQPWGVSDEPTGVKIPPPAPEPNLSEILAFAFWMRKQGYRPSTIHAAVSTLKAVAKKANLLNQDAVKTHLASISVSVGRKEKICQDLARFYKFKQMPFQMPRYHRNDTIPFVPQEKEVDQLISACGKKTATFLQLLRETGIRPGEVWRLAWVDVDLEHATVGINNPEKGSNCREFKNRSSKLVAMLHSLKKPRRFVFHADNPSSEAYKNFVHEFFEQRKRIAREFGNDRLLRVNFRSLRHFKGTAEYLRTRDIFHVKRVLGHKSIKNTEIYINIVGFDDNENYVCKVASTKEERIALIEAGFQRVGKDGGEWYFRKRK